MNDAAPSLQLPDKMRNVPGIAAGAERRIAPSHRAAGRD
jgi:hypothetical protein